VVSRAAAAFVQFTLKRADLFFSFFVGDTVAFFDLAGELFHASFGNLQIVVGQLSPVLFDVA
jgi:hypothetical protein